ncbi:Sulfite exporter TauE/SafE family protein 3 [Glycine soja]|nr:hypothetical protein JHK85_002160 [Glycine max]KHN36120.1 hypothetical protein glysoja_003243 [Glycine soja]
MATKVKRKTFSIAAATWMVLCIITMICNVSLADRILKEKELGNDVPKERQGILKAIVNFLWEEGKSSYEPVWPNMKFGWRIIVGSIIGFLGAALGSVGGVGGGGIFVPMLALIIGFDPKSSTAISKCMIMGASISTVYYNLRLRHPTLDMPLIDYDLALIFQPMLMLGISIGVICNVMFADWMVTVLLIILFIATSTKATYKGIDTWKKETIAKKEASKLLEAEPKSGDDYKSLPSGPTESLFEEEYTKPCSIQFWLLNFLQVPVAVSVTLFEAIGLYKGTRVIASKGKEVTNWKIHQICLYCSTGIMAGMVGGLLGLGGGFILGPLFLELGIPPQVASATSTFAMVFSSSMSVVQYYLLDRFPVPYASYFALVATIAAFTGQHVVRKVIVVLGRASIIIFILALTIFISAISLGGVGIENIIEKIENHEYMGFEDLCALS